MQSCISEADGSVIACIDTTEVKRHGQCTDARLRNQQEEPGNENVGSNGGSSIATVDYRGLTTGLAKLSG